MVQAHRLVDERGCGRCRSGSPRTSCAHTFASILVAIGKDPTYVMQQLGHTDPAFTLRVYIHAICRSGEERAKLKALVEGHDWAHGQNGRIDVLGGLSTTPTETQKALR